MPSKEMIGRVLSTGSATVSAEHVAAFARALGDPNPLYVDPETARRGPFGTIVAPPTYPIAFMAQALAGVADVLLELGLNFMTLVHDELEPDTGSPGALAPWMLAMGYLAACLVQAGGVGAIRRFKTRFAKLTWPGDVITCRGRVTRVADEGGERRVECEIWSENQAGERKLLGSATLALPRA